MKPTIFFISVIAVLLYLLICPKEAFLASTNGLMLWFHTILPTLLPFLILSDLLIHSEKTEELLKKFHYFFKKVFFLSPYGGYAFCLGLFCGYPMGARITAELLKEHKISLEEAQYLLTFVNNASPAFIQNYVLLHALHMDNHTGITFAILYTSTYLTSLCFRKKFHSCTIAAQETSYGEITVSSHSSGWKYSLNRLIDTSIMSGFETITRIGGYLILFSILASMITKLTSPVPFLSVLLTGFVEITTGIQHLSASSLPFTIKYLLVLCFTSFGGLSAMEQTRGMLSGTPLSIHTYFVGKLVNTGITLLLGGCYLLFCILL